MSDDTDYHRAVARGRRAALELEQTAAAFDAVKEVTVEALIQTGTGADQAAKRERLLVTLQILKAVRETVEQVAGDGVAADIALAQSGLTRR